MRAPGTPEARELYSLLGRPFYTLTEAEWRQWQDRWAGLFAVPLPPDAPLPCGIPQDPSIRF